MSFKNVDIESAMRRLADRRIEEAMREGKFDNLQGAGKPLELEAIPAGEEARLAWWALRIFRQNDYTPEEVRWRKQVDSFRDEIAAATTERRVRALVEARNQLVRQINTLGTNALRTAVAPLTVETEVGKFRERQGLPSGRQCSNGACKCVNPGPAQYCRRCGALV